MKKLTSDQLNRIRSSIRQAESQTSAEVVPMIVSHSDVYWNTHWAWGVGFALAASGYAGFASARAPEPWSITQVILLQGLCGGLGFLLPFISFLKRLSIPQKRFSHAVHQRCLADFIDAGLLNTRERTGILIYISLFERRVHIVADQGISQTISNDYWDDQVRRLAEGIRLGKGPDALCQVIEEMGRKLAPFFPRKADDKNELPDTLRLGHPTAEDE